MQNVSSSGHAFTSPQLWYIQHTRKRSLVCFIASLLFHVSLLPLRGFGAYSKPTPLKEYTLRVEIEQPEREEERKVEPPKPTPQPQPQHRPRPVKSPQVAARKAGKPTVVRQMPQRVQPKQPAQQMKAVPSKRKVVTVRTPHTQIAMRLHKDARATERPRVKPAVVPPATFKTDREVTAPTLRKRQRIAKALPKFGERLVTERREIIPAQAERPSAQRTTSPIVEIARSVRKPRARPQATLSSPQTLPTVAGVGAQRRPGLTAPAPQEAEVARLPDAPTGRRGAMRPKRRPQPSQAPIAAAFLPEGRGGAKRRGAFESGGGSGAHAPQRLQIGRPIGRGVGFSRPRPNAYGSAITPGRGAPMGGLLRRLVGIARPTEAVSGVGKGKGGRGGDKLRPAQRIGLGETLRGKGRPRPSGFGGAGGGGAMPGAGAGLGTGGGAGIGSFGIPRSIKRGRGIGTGGEGTGAPRLTGAPRIGGGTGIGAGERGRGTGAGKGYRGGAGPITGGSGAGSVGRGGGGGRKAKPGPPAIGFGEKVTGYRKGVQRGGGSGAGEPPFGTSPKGGLLTKRGRGDGGGGIGERPGIGGAIGGGGKGKGKGAGVSIGGASPMQRREIERPTRFVARVPKSTMGGLYTDLAGDFSRIPIIAIVDKSNWHVHVNAVKNLLREFNRRTKIRTAIYERKVPLTLNAIKDTPILFFYGETAFTLTPQEREVLRQYIKLGGTIFGDNSHGPFDVSFPREMCKTFGKRMSDWVQLPISHPIYRAFYIFSAVPPGDLGETYPIQGLKVNGRFAVLYSRNDYSDVRADYHPGKIAPPIPEMVREAAYRFGINIIIYAYANWQKMRGGK